MTALNESTVELAALEFLHQLGWSTTFGPSIARDTPSAQAGVSPRPDAGRGCPDQPGARSVRDRRGGHAAGAGRSSERDRQSDRGTRCLILVA